MKSSKTLDKLYKRKLRLPPDHDAHRRYKEYRNIYNRTKRLSKQTYYADILEQYKGNIKRTWQVLRPLLGKVSDKSNVHQEFLVENRFISEPRVIADKFCQYFTSVGHN